ncbi:Ulp1 protease family protein [Colletotrichum chrysophilum]|uniref:Ulp1 protease family protein n=1 Tax=Colletotrichum chrysophilum TaxID=1836956 RepID=A0AAD9A398_9PEZI|nr:Ulp1 protease family protein [Colletotrichum chrysophilum]
MGLTDSLTLAKAGHERLERCRERLAPLLLAENVMMPSCDKSHWRLFVYNRPTHTISELDSLEPRNYIAEEQVIPTLSWLYGAAWRPKSKFKNSICGSPIHSDVSSPSPARQANAARQENGNDYGVLVVAFGMIGSVPSRVNAPACRRHLHQALLTSPDAGVPVDMCASFSSIMPTTGADASTRATYRRAVGKKLRVMISEVKANKRDKTEQHHEKLARVLRAKVGLFGAIDGLIQLHATHQAALEEWLRHPQYLDTVGQVEEALTQANRMALRAIDLLKAAILARQAGREDASSDTDGPEKAQDFRTTEQCARGHRSDGSGRARKWEEAEDERIMSASAQTHAHGDQIGGGQFWALEGLDTDRLLGGNQLFSP